MYHIGVIMPSDPQQHIMQYKNRAAWNQVRWVIQIIQATIQLQIGSLHPKAAGKAIDQLIGKQNEFKQKTYVHTGSLSHAADKSN